MMSVLPNQRLSWELSSSDRFSVSFQPVLYRPHTQTRIAFSRLTNKHSQFGTFSQPCFNWTFSNCLSHCCPATGWPCRFRPRGKTGSSILDHDLGHLCRGRRIQMSGHSDFGILNNFGASSIVTWVQADTASADCPADPGSLDFMSQWANLAQTVNWRGFFDLKNVVPQYAPPNGETTSPYLLPF